MSTIFHITTAVAWAEGQKQGAYRTPSLDSEGFIHCSRPGQTVATANHYFTGQHSLVILVIATENVRAEVRFENTSGGTELYPHIYGALNPDAVSAVLPFAPDADGRFTRLPDGAPAA